MLVIFLLFVFTVLNEFFVVIYTDSIQKKNKYVASLISATMEPLRIVSILFVVENNYKLLSVISVSAGCALGSFITLYWMGKQKAKKKLEKKIKKSQQIKENININK